MMSNTPTLIPPSEFNPSGAGSMKSSECSLLDARLEKEAVRRLDYTILPTMTMFYFLSFLDRANIGNARLAGLQQDLKLSDHQYQVCITVLYVPYILAELPSNLLLRRIGPARLMPTLLVIWGTIATLQGVVTSYGGLIALRVLLGLVEGPMFPGIVLYLSGFYTRADLSLRIALFFSSASLSGAFSGLLAAAIQNMDGIGGKAGWAWIFILEGLFSVIVGIAGFFLVTPSVPESRFLTDPQKDIINRRLERDRPTITPTDRFSLKEIVGSVNSPHVILMFPVFFMLGTGIYGLANFLPSVVRQLGYSATQSQLLSVGPFAASFCVTLVSAYYSDRYNTRAVPAILLYCLAVVGFAIYLSTHQKAVAYGSLFLSVSGVYAAGPILSAWTANNSEPHYRRATTIALAFIATNSGGILSTWRFPTKEGPRFTKTIIMNLIFWISSILIIVVSLANCLLLNWMNASKKRQRSRILEPYTDEKSSDGGPRAWMELGDKHPDFQYTL